MSRIMSESEYLTAVALDDAIGTAVEIRDFLDRRDEDHYEQDAYTRAESYRDEDPSAIALLADDYRTETRSERKARYAREDARKARASHYPESSQYVERTLANGERAADFYALPNRTASFITVHRTEEGDLIGVTCKCGARLSWEAFDGTQQDYALRVAQHTYTHTSEGKAMFPHAPKFIDARNERHAKWEAQYAERESYRAGRLLDHGRTLD